MASVHGARARAQTDHVTDVNTMAANLTAQVRAIAEVTTAVATGDLSKKVAIEVKGEILELKNTINTMVGTDAPSAGVLLAYRVAPQINYLHSPPKCLVWRWRSVLRVSSAVKHKSRVSAVCGRTSPIVRCDA